MEQTPHKHAVPPLPIHATSDNSGRSAVNATRSLLSRPKQLVFRTTKGTQVFSELFSSLGRDREEIKAHYTNFKEHFPAVLHATDS